MLFKKRDKEPIAPEPAASDIFGVDEVPEAHRVAHGRYTIIPKTKHLHNGNWIVAIVLQEKREDGNRLYDFFGPMTEHASEEEARRAGVEHAVQRIDEQSTQ